MTCSNQNKVVDIGKLLRGASPEIRDLLRLAHEQGYTVTRRGGHFSITTPPGHHPRDVAFSQKTPSDYKGVKNTRARLRRMGVVIPHQGR